MLKIPYICLPAELLRDGFPADDVFQSAEMHCIDRLNWPKSFPYAPEVTFRTLHNGETLFLQYDVAEKCTRALEKLDGNYVYMDSCVEFFIRFDGEFCYYNFEWNAAGTMYMTYRPGRESAEPASPDIMSSVRRTSTVGPAPVEEYYGDNKWRLRVAIPVEAFWHSGVRSLCGLKATANLFKCGDGLTVPHYLSWASIDTPTPDYHRPEFFDEVEFGE